MIDLVYYTVFPMNIVPDDLIVVGRGGTRGDVTVFIKGDQADNIKTVTVTDSFGLPRLNLALGSVTSQSPDGYYAINAHPSDWNEYLDEGVKFNPEYKTRDELSLIVEHSEQDPFYEINKLDLLYKLYDRLMV